MQSVNAPVSPLRRVQIAIVMHERRVDWRGENDATSAGSDQRWSTKRDLIDIAAHYIKLPEGLSNRAVLHQTKTLLLPATATRSGF